VSNNTQSNRRTSSAFAGLSAGCALALLGSVGASADVYRSHHDHVLGTSLDVTVVADHAASAEAAEAAALAQITRLDAIFSTYVTDSELMGLNAVESAVVSRELFDVLSACADWRARTDGALSCRVAPLMQVWRDAEESDEEPNRPDLRRLAGRLRRAAVVLDSDTRRVTRPDPVAFDANALAKGFIIDAALAAARDAAPEAQGILIDIGGDLRAWGDAPDGSDGSDAPGGGWRVGVASPNDAADNAELDVVLNITDRAVASSGRGARDRIIDGRSYGHVISPFDGWPVDGVAAATVVAADAMTADALATAFMVMPLRASLDLAEAEEGVEALIVASDGRRYETAGWSALTIAAPNQGGDVLTSAWPDGFALQVDYVIPDGDAADYENPYVAIWITDADRNLVRVLQLLGVRSRWMEENYIWHRRYGRKVGSLVDAVARPTRRPGAYSVVWDGQDDDGAPTPPGTYILHVEAAREHGAHQYTTLDIAVVEDMFEETMLAGEELGAVAVRYGPAP